MKCCGIFTALLLVVPLFWFAACRSTPKTEGPVADLSGTSRNADQDIPELPELPELPDLSALNNGDIPDEVFEGALIEPELEFAESDYSVPPSGDEPDPVEAPDPAVPEIPQIAAVETPPPPPQQTPPARQTPPPPAPVPPVLPPPVPPPAAPPPPPRQTPPPPERTPPPEPPVFLVPSEPVDEAPAFSSAPSLIPDMPFRPPAVKDEDINYSRTVKAVTGQYVEIPFRGPGWVYLGEQGSRRGVYYDSRRIENEGMTFVFRADEPGTYSLKFNRQDFIRDTVLNDFVQVIVESPPQITGTAWSNTGTLPDRVYAVPRWPPAVPPAAPVPAASPAVSAPAQDTAASPAISAGPGYPVEAAGAGMAAGAEGPPGPPGEASSAGAERPAAAWEPAGAGTGAAPAGRPAETPSGVDGYLSKAKTEYDAGRIAGALEALDQFRKQFPAGSDEAWWLYAQALEANGPNRDIRLSLDYYRRLVREYPQSVRYDDAVKRIAYLERFYFNIQ
jgi:hypothetical protein